VALVGGALTVAGELVDRGPLHTLRTVVDELPGRPTRRDEAATQVVDVSLRDLDGEGFGIDGESRGSDQGRGGHSGLLSRAVPGLCVAQDTPDNQCRTAAITRRFRRQIGRVCVSNVKCLVQAL